MDKELLKRLDKIEEKIDLILSGMYNLSRLYMINEEISKKYVSYLNSHITNGVGSGGGTN